MLTAAMCVLFAAVVCYVVFSLRSLPEPVPEPSEPADASAPDIPLCGLVVREEEPLFSPRPHVRLIAEDGQRVGAGDALGCACDTEAQLRRTLELTQLLSALRAAAAPPSAREARLSLSACIARRDMAALSLAVRAVHYSALPDGADTAHRDEARLLDRIEALPPGSDEDAVLLTSPAAGFFCTPYRAADTPAPSELAALTPDTLSRYLSAESEPSAAFGRLITGSTWYFAALAPAENGAALVPGTCVSLTLRALPSAVTAQLLSVSEPDEGVCVVVFALREALAEVLSLRYTEGSVPMPDREILP